jgi:3-(3-hydroxy-phenyl)propionate hydroxylase
VTTLDRVRPDKTCDVVIIGAGPTGLTLANLLGEAGVATILVERNEFTVQAPRAVSIDDESLRTMQACGLIDDVMANVAPDYGSHYMSMSGINFARVEPTTREYGYPRRSAFTQPELEATLRQGLSRWASVEPLFQHMFESVAEDADGVTVAIKRLDGTPLTIRATYLAACDGGRSALRKIIGAELQGSTYPDKWLIVDMEETKERLRQTRVLCNPARAAICLPGPDGKRRYEFKLREGESDEEIATPESVKKLLAAYGPDADAKIVRRQVYAFHARVCDTWNSKHIYLAGDAAHLTPPFAGQGMNSGVRDAHALAWRFTAIAKGNLGPGVLDTYQTERKPHAWALIEFAINIGRVMMPTSPVQAFLVQGAFRLMRFVPKLQNYFAQMKFKPKPYYKHGFLVEDEASKVIGRMFPQPTVELLDRSTAKMDTLIGNHFALIAYGENAQATIAQAQGEDFGLKDLRLLAISPMRLNIDRRADPAILACRDVDGLLEAMLPVAKDSLVVVRPDRYTMAAATITSPADIARLADAVRQRVAASRET